MAKLASAQAQNFSIPHFVCCVNVFSLFAINLRTAKEQRILVMPSYPISTNFTPYICMYNFQSLLFDTFSKRCWSQNIYTEYSPLTKNTFNSKFNIIFLRYLYWPKSPDVSEGLESVPIILEHQIDDHTSCGPAALHSVRDNTF